MTLAHRTERECFLDSEHLFAYRQGDARPADLDSVVVDEDGRVLDNHHRLRVCSDLGVEYPTRLVAGSPRPHPKVIRRIVPPPKST